MIVTSVSLKTPLVSLQLTLRQSNRSDDWLPQLLDVQAEHKSKILKARPRGKALEENDSERSICGQY